MYNLLARGASDTQVGRRIHQVEREELHKQYLARAKGVLTEEQMGPFEKFLGSQRALQDTGMKMAVKIFGAKTDGN